MARRALRPGDPITVDYATFRCEDMEPFTCQCDSAACRGTIRGTDWALPAIAAYGEHVSDQVRRKRQGLS